MAEHHSVVIVGSGFGGLGMAIQLKRDGVEDFAIFEKADDLGGTWRENTYPGCACDVPSVMYSLSYAPNPNWSQLFAPAAEILDYERRVAKEYGLGAHIRYGHEVNSAAWDEDASRWEIQTNAGDYTADVVIAAVGPLHESSTPSLPGIESFAGHTFHSSKWDHEFRLQGTRVAVIGTGASSIQIVPEIQPQVAHLDLFQRTPPWVLPRFDPKIPRGVQLLFRAVPAIQKALRGVVYGVAESVGYSFHQPWLTALLGRVGRAHIKQQVKDPELVAKLTPSYQVGCKRILTSNSYYPALCAPNAELVTSGIKEVCAEGIIDGDGKLHELDAIIYGTGFRVVPMGVGDIVRGRDGRTLNEHWEGSPKAYFGTAVTGFPNFYTLIGPGTGLGHNSLIYMIEAQATYISGALRFMREHELATIEPRAEAQARWVEKIDRQMADTVWMQGGCSSWYVDDTGRNSTLWPQSTWRFRREISTFVPSDNILGLSTPAREAVTA